MHIRSPRVPDIIKQIRYAYRVITFGLDTTPLIANVSPNW